MNKLYKRIDGILHYHEAWESDGKIIEHWGRVGDRGTQMNHEIPHGQLEEDAIKTLLQGARSRGYDEIVDDDHAMIVISYPVEGMGTTKDLDKRHSLEDRMNETLGWTGLGHCDGGSTGSDSMEVCCYVVDSEIAKRIIANDLKGTAFSDYSRIEEE